MNSSLRLLILVATIWVLSACSTFKTQPTPADLDWSFTGKMAIRNATEAQSFNVDWLQMGETFQIRLYGPLGQGEVIIKGNPQQVTLIKGDQRLESHSLNGLLYESTGMDLPLDHLQYWVRAKPMPFETHLAKLNDTGQVSQIDQSGWTVLISDYFDETTPRPRKLSFANQRDSGKLVIREWNALTTPE